MGNESDGELKEYKRLIGDTNDYIVDVYFAGYLPIMDAYIYVLEKLEVIWEDLDYNFTEWFNYLFSNKQIHEKIDFIPDIMYMNVIFEKLYTTEFDERF